MHEHFDIDGEPCIAMYAHTTVVTREPEWDEASRGRAMRLAEHERSIDSETGLPIVEAYRDQPFIVRNDPVNYAARALDKARTKQVDEHPEGWGDHRTFYVEVYDPDAPPD